MTIFHLRDLASGKRRIVKAESVKVFQVPQYEGLTIEDMLSFASAHPQVREALPLEQREIDKLPREYISNVCHTLIGDSFKNWVDAQIRARNQKIKDQQNVLVDLDPEIARLFQASTSVSGKSKSWACLLYTSPSPRD